MGDSKFTVHHVCENVLTDGYVLALEAHRLKAVGSSLNLTLIHIMNKKGY